MKFITLFLAFVALSTAQKVFPLFSTVSANAWSQQYFKIQNSGSRSQGMDALFNNVYFEVLVLSSDSSSERLGVFYGHNQPLGFVGAINGMSNGTGSFYVFGDAGTYSVEFLITYQQNGQQQLSTQGPFTFVVGGAQASREAEVVLANEDFQLVRETKRDDQGSNTDMATQGSSADGFYAYTAQMTYNSWTLQVGSAAIKNVSVSYTMVTLQTSVSFGGSPNGTQSNAALAAKGTYPYDFSITGPSSNGATWYMNISITYKKASALAFSTWWVQEGFQIATPGATSSRRALDIKSFSQIAAESQQAQAKGAEAARAGYAFAAAGAGVAVIAAVAIVVALVTIRKNKQIATVA